nr:zinc finger protein 552-like [Biomphalaria glabrata]
MALDVVINVNETSDGDDEDWTGGSGGSGDYHSPDTTFKSTLPPSLPRTLPISDLTLSIIIALVAAVVVCLLIVLVFWCRRRRSKRNRMPNQMAVSFVSTSTSTVLCSATNDRTFNKWDSRGKELTFNNTTKPGPSRYDDYSPNDFNPDDYLKPEVHHYEKVV